ncbi:hypothetical protein [Streptomyces sp. TE5632]
MSEQPSQPPGFGSPNSGAAGQSGPYGYPQPGYPQAGHQQRPGFPQGERAPIQWIGALGRHGAERRENVRSGA